MAPRRLGDTSKPFVLIASLLSMAVGFFGTGTAEAAADQPGQFRAACVKVDITPDTLLGKRILAANAAIENTTADVTLRVAKMVVETPRKAALGWPDNLADYSSISSDATPQVRVPVYSLTINSDTMIWAAPLELFTEVSLSVREASPFTRTFYFGLTNGSLLYLPTKAAFAEGGYEPNVSPFTDRAEADFTSAVTRYLRQRKRKI